MHSILKLRTLTTDAQVSDIAIVPWSVPELMSNQEELICTQRVKFWLCKIPNTYQSKNIMLTYFIGFTLLGFIIRKVITDDKSALIAILGIALIWGFTHQLILGFVTLGELFLGYTISNIITKK
jgi:hypothetical protein